MLGFIPCINGTLAYSSIVPFLGDDATEPRVLPKSFLADLYMFNPCGPSKSVDDLGESIMLLTDVLFIAFLIP